MEPRDENPKWKWKRGQAMAVNERENSDVLRLGGNFLRASELRNHRPHISFRVFDRWPSTLRNLYRLMGRQKGNVVPPPAKHPPSVVKIDPPVYLKCNNLLRKWAHEHAYLFWFNMIFFLPTWVYLVIDRLTR